MPVSAYADVASAFIAALALLFAGWQLLILNRQAAHERDVSLKGVVVSWVALEAPDHGDGEGQAEWLYEFEVHNPGRLPIDDVLVRCTLPHPVRRVRYSGRLGDATETLTLRTPVIAGGGRRTWKRRLRKDFANATDLKQTFAEVSFVDVDGAPRVNRWPRSKGGKLPEHGGEDG